MSKKKHLFANVGRLLLITFAVLYVFTGTTLPQGISSKLTLQNAPLTIAKTNNMTQTINNVPSKLAGVFEFKIKWHAKALIPNTFNQLK
ncbi:MAG: hypothetical protein LC778_21535, partial [Acidobacteria bacterium]|nr:hypothetical protein [Acidobacteriota bacterium]